MYRCIFIHTYLYPKDGYILEFRRDFQYISKRAAALILVFLSHRRRRRRRRCRRPPPLLSCSFTMQSCPAPSQGSPVLLLHKAPLVLSCPVISCGFFGRGHGQDEVGVHLCLTHSARSFRTACEKSVEAFWAQGVCKSGWYSAGFGQAFSTVFAWCLICLL